MRLRHKESLRRFKAHYAFSRTLWLVGRICGWLGEKFISLSLYALSVSCNAKKERNSAAGEIEPLLPLHCCGNNGQSESVKPELICPSCKRNVDELREVVAMDGPLWIKAIRCVDCMDIALEHLHQLEQFREN